MGEHELSARDALDRLRSTLELGSGETRVVGRVRPRTARVRQALSSGATEREKWLGLRALQEMPVGERATWACRLLVSCLQEMSEVERVQWWCSHYGWFAREQLRRLLGELPGGAGGGADRQ